MKRIIFAALILTFVTGAAFSATKSKKATALKQPAAKQAAVSTVPLSALFPPATEESHRGREGNGLDGCAEPRSRSRPHQRGRYAIARLRGQARLPRANFLANQKTADAPAAKQAQ